ncbi:MAG: hypothetical protein JST16_05125 [Bdellovibrionales bacterium]|nr:hypothetical protein [Bdellovibrionales bacterium]
MTLLDQIATFENLEAAFRECRVGKRYAFDYQRILPDYGELLVRVVEALRQDAYAWRGYREFYVHDPKARIVMCAPFIDRVVHHAIHRVIEPIVDPFLSEAVFACRHGKGNRRAVLALGSTLRAVGEERFVVKLDVSKYFASIRHPVLMELMEEVLPDRSLHHLLWSLLKSHAGYAELGYGIPIGNLTSQLFANFYLSPADRAVEEALEAGCGGRTYLRYMDDLVIVGRTKGEALDAADEAVRVAEGRLKLSIPRRKRVPLGRAPVPFLGYVLSHRGYRILKRNERRLHKKVKRLERQGARPSRIAQVVQSFQAWRCLKI